MALQQPTNIIPSTFATNGGGTITASDPISISWQPNGNSPMTKFGFTIYDITGDNVLYTFTSNLNDASLGLPFYPTDSKGNPQIFAFTSTTIWNEADVYNGDEYRLVITQYWGENAENSIVQTSPSVFRARTQPSLTLVAPGVVTTPQATFTANYSQAEGDGINYVRWMLTSLADGEVLADTGRINTSLLAFTFNGFLTGQRYRLSLVVETTSGVVVSVERTLRANYATVGIAVPITASCQKDNSVLVSWEQLATIPGIPSAAEGINISNGLLTVSAGDVIWYTVNGEDMNLPAPYSFGWSGKPLITAGESVVLFQISSAKEIRFQAQRNTSGWFFSLIYDNAEIVNYIPTTVEDFDSMQVWLTPKEFTIEINTGGIIDEFKQAFPFELFNVEAVSLYASQVCYYMYITGDVSYPIPALGMAPERTGDTLFYADFDDGTLGAGLGDDVGYNIAIYRKSPSDAVMGLLAEGLGKNIRKIKDYGALSQKPYDYSLFSASENNQYSPITSTNPVCRRYTSYTLIEATEDENNPNIFHVLRIWLFGNNLAPMDISNNNAPSFLQNFTPYPLRQPTAPTYKSGTLTALLSNAVGGKYADTAEQAKAVYDISTSLNVFFLKDMKGNLYMVHTSNAISATINTGTAIQETTISIPWQETGSAEGISLIQLPTDEGWAQMNTVAEAGIATLDEIESIEGFMLDDEMGGVDIGNT